MPPTKRAVKSAFDVLIAAGFVPPSTWTSGPDEERRAAQRATYEVWHKALAVLDDASLEAAVAEHAAGGRFWPKPGELLALAPQRRIPATATPRRLDEIAGWTDLTREEFDRIDAELTELESSDAQELWDWMNGRTRQILAERSMGAA